MGNKPVPVVALADLIAGQEADVFALLAAKEQLTTRDGKPYFRVTFRDARREVTFPIWNDSLWADDCRQAWSPGAFYKLRAIYRETSYGPQLDIRKIREATEADRGEGFDPLDLFPRTRFEPSELFEQLLAVARDRIGDADLRGLVAGLLETHREALLVLPAATRNHHAMVGGYLEHVLAVTQTAAFLAEHYARLYDDLRPPLNVDLVIAGAILHDIGKLREIEWRPQGASYTPAGNLVGHLLQGRDIVREAAAGHSIDPEVLLRLEHIIISHQRLPEWGSPKPPMTPEALLVHYADDCDAKFHMMYVALRDESGEGHMTTRHNRLFQQIFRGNG